MRAVISVEHRKQNDKGEILVQKIFENYGVGQPLLGILLYTQTLKYVI